MKEILVLDHDDESAHCACFILELAGFASVRACSGLETIHFVSSRKKIASPYALLLLSRWHASYPVEALVGDIRAIDSASPILIINRQESGPGARPPYGVLCCSPTEMIDVVARLLRTPRSVNIISTASHG